MGRLHGLDALRGVAALMVFYHHLATNFRVPIAFYNFGLSVDLFLVISGFVMTRVYERRIGTTISPIQFIGIRYRRLWAAPAVGAYIGLLAFAIWGLLTPGLVLAIIPLLLFLPAPWVDRGGFAMNGPVWSLFVEIVCNALHAFAFARIPSRYLLALATSSGAVYIATTFAHGDILWGPKPIETLLAIPRGVTAYLLGIVICRKWGVAPLGRWPVVAVFAFPLLMALPVPVWIMAPVVTFVVAPLLLRMSLGMGAAKWATLLGLLSFPLYAIHVPAFYLARALHLPPLAAAIGALMLAAALTLALERKAISQMLGSHQPRLDEPQAHVERISRIAQ